MAKVMLINVTHAEESRVAIVADGTLVSFEIESFNREHLKGNIYKGVVQRVHPALEAAFVDIGAERHAFLPLDEICFRQLPHPVRLGGNGERRRPRIQDILKPGDELLVQIVKEQFGSKPPTLTTFFSLPGRFLVLLPGSDDAGISRRIEGADRVRVREMIEKLQPPEGFGIIVRTVVGFDPGLADLQRDLTYLLRLWESILHAAQAKRAPALIYREHDLVLRNIRDYFTPDIDEIYVDNEEVFERARQFLRDVLPEKEHALRLYEGDKPIFSHFNIEAQIESVYKRKVPLKSGGYIVIDGTEALTAIDVNSGRAIRGASQEETAFRTNLEAAVEIARQLRLRDVGGLIVIDFIDMRNPQHISEVEKALRTAMFEDKARHEVGRISHFGLLEVSRQRLRPAATATTYVTCRMCDGYGLVRTTESAALVALRKVHNRVAQGDVGSASVSVPADVAMYLLNQKREDLTQLERRYGVKIVVHPREDLMPHQCEIEVKPRSEAAPAEVASLRLGGLAAAAGNGASITHETEPPAEEPRSVETATPGASAAAPAPPATEEKAEGATRKRRRRGRRRGRGRLAAESLQIMVQTLAGRGGGVSSAEERAASVEDAEAVQAAELGTDAEAYEPEDKEALARTQEATAAGCGVDQAHAVAGSPGLAPTADRLAPEPAESGARGDTADITVEVSRHAAVPQSREPQRGQPTGAVQEATPVAEPSPGVHSPSVGAFAGTAFGKVASLQRSTGEIEAEGLPPVGSQSPSEVGSSVAGEIGPEDASESGEPKASPVSEADASTAGEGDRASRPRGKRSRAGGSTRSRTKQPKPKRAVKAETRSKSASGRARSKRTARSQSTKKAQSDTGQGRRRRPTSSEPSEAE